VPSEAHQCRMPQGILGKYKATLRHAVWADVESAPSAQKAGTHTVMQRDGGLGAEPRAPYEWLATFYNVFRKATRSCFCWLVRPRANR
jgi:hypothetical protein